MTHEPDIAACASRVINMRDGRVRSDVSDTSPVQRPRPPVDAHKALAELPADASPESQTESPVDPQAAP